MKPIIFSTPMVQAILDGRKTQTRRIVKANIVDRFVLDDSGNILGSYTEGMPEVYPTIDDAPYQLGDILWVREAWMESDGKYYYRADLGDYLDKCETISGGYPADCRFYPGCDGCMRRPTKIKYRPSIHMPREAARIFLRVKNVRVERLQDISPKDCYAEGIIYVPIGEKWAEDGWAVAKYAHLWNKINEKRGYGWDTNPWVWVYEFEKINRAGGE